MTAATAEPAAVKERVGFLRLTPSRAKSLRRQVRLFRSSPLAVLGFVLIVFALAVALLGPFVAPYHPSEIFVRGETQQQWPIDYGQKLQSPSSDHLFGTTEQGYDLFSMVLYGAAVSLRVAFVAVIATVVIGVVLGAFAGYYGGLVDEVIMRVTDVFLSIPSLILALAVVAALGRSLDHVMYAIIAVSWPGYTRLVRASFLQLRENQYVEAARGVGATDTRIIFRHILPNGLSPVLVSASLDVGNFILTAAALSFLGLGAPPGTAEWGLLVAQGSTYFPQNWWYVFFPGLAIVVTVLGFNLLGDGLRDVIDPKLRK